MQSSLFWNLHLSLRWLYILHTVDVIWSMTNRSLSFRITFCPVLLSEGEESSLCQVACLFRVETGWLFNVFPVPRLLRISGLLLDNLLMHGRFSVLYCKFPFTSPLLVLYLIDRFFTESKSPKLKKCDKFLSKVALLVLLWATPRTVWRTPSPSSTCSSRSRHLPRMTKTKDNQYPVLSLSWLM